MAKKRKSAFDTVLSKKNSSPADNPRLTLPLDTMPDDLIIKQLVSNFNGLTAFDRAYLMYEGSNCVLVVLLMNYVMYLRGGHDYEELGNPNILELVLNRNRTGSTSDEEKEVRLGLCSDLLATMVRWGYFVPRDMLSSTTNIEFTLFDWLDVHNGNLEDLDAMIKHIDNLTPEMVAGALENCVFSPEVTKALLKLKSDLERTGLQKIPTEKNVESESRLKAILESAV